MDIVKALKEILENPDDLSGLPAIIEQMAVVQKELDDTQEKVGKLHELNRKYLGMIPIHDGTETPEKAEAETPAVTVEQAVQQIMEDIIK